MNRLLVLTAIFFMFSYTFAQYPIDKDIEVGKKEINNFLVKNGFTFYKEKEIDFPDTNNTPTRQCIDLSYKQEITVSLYYNSYGNIKTISIVTFNHSIMSKVLKIYNFDNWTYLTKDRDFFGSQSYYKYGSYYIKMPHGNIAQIWIQKTPF